VARTSWFDEKAEHSLIQEKAAKLESFTNALADGVVTTQELAGQEQRLVAAMKALEPALSDDLPYMKRDGGFVLACYDASLDETRGLRDESRRVVAALQASHPLICFRVERRSAHDPRQVIVRGMLLIRGLISTGAVIRPDRRHSVRVRGRHHRQHRVDHRLAVTFPQNGHGDPACTRSRHATTAGNGGYDRFRKEPSAEIRLRSGEKLAKKPDDTSVNNGDLDPGRDFTITAFSRASAQRERYRRCRSSRCRRSRARRTESDRERIADPGLHPRASGRAWAPGRSPSRRARRLGRQRGGDAPFSQLLLDCGTISRRFPHRGRQRAERLIAQPVAEFRAEDALDAAERVAALRTRSSCASPTPRSAKPMVCSAREPAFEVRSAPVPESPPPVLSVSAAWSITCSRMLGCPDALSRRGARRCRGASGRCRPAARPV
jgi:hypothetical protein